MIYHLASQQDWERARRDGVYAISTRGRTLAEEGFIHASSVAQWPVVRRRFYGDVADPLVLLHIDESRLSSPVVDEVGDPATGERFPHVYGPIDLDAVVATTVVEPPHGESPHGAVGPGQSSDDELDDLHGAQSQ